MSALAMAIADLQRADIQAMMAEKTGKPAAQRNLLKAIRLLLAFAVDSGLRTDNPALGIKRPKQRSGGYYSATEDDLRRYEACYPRGTASASLSISCSTPPAAVPTW